MTERLVPEQLLANLRRHVLFAHYSMSGPERRQQAVTLANEVAKILAAAPEPVSEERRASITHWNAALEFSARICEECRMIVTETDPIKIAQEVGREMGKQIRVLVAKNSAAISATKAVHKDHPLRHFDRTCPACIQEGNDMAQATINGHAAAPDEGGQKNGARADASEARNSESGANPERSTLPPAPGGDELAGGAVECCRCHRIVTEACGARPCGFKWDEAESEDSDDEISAHVHQINGKTWVREYHYNARITELAALKERHEPVRVALLQWLADREAWLKRDGDNGGDCEHLDIRRQECRHIRERLQSIEVIS